MAAPVILLRASTYSGSGTWNDESGNGKNATLSAGTIAKNAKGNGIVLNGSTSWTFPNVALGNAWSVNVWYKNIGSFSQYSGILTQLIASGPFRSNLLIGNTGASGTGSQISVNHFNKNTGGGDWNIGTNITSDLLTGNWINIQATWDGSSIKTYINGNIVGTVTTNGVSIDNGNAYYIGTSYNGVAPFVTGEIGEVRLYNYAITGAKVVADYNASSPTYPRLMVLLSAVNYSGTGSWLDSSVNGNNATLETGTVAKNIAGNGIVLNGSTSWTFPNVALGNSYTVNVWYKNTNISAWGNILTQIGEAPNNNFSMGSLTGNSDGKIAIGYPSRAMSDYFSLTTGAWTNIQATWNGTTLYVYINSVLTQTKTPGVTLIDGGNAYRIGWCWNQSVPKITGEIGEVRMYNFALTQEEVSADYISSYKSYFWQPTRIGGLQLWLDANDQSSFAMNGSRVSQWSDKSGSANNMTQVTSAYQPSLSINNGMNFVNTETGAYMRNTNITFGPQYSIFAIGKTNNAIDGKFHYLLSTGTSGGLFMLSSVDNNFTTNVGGQSSWNSLGANTPLTSVTSLSLMEMLNGGTSTTLLSYVNGTALNPKNGTTLATTGIFIGWNNGNQFWDGLIGEVLVYNGLLSSLQREVVEGYLSWKWGLQASLPSSHSFYSLPPIYNEYITVPPIFLLRASSYSGSGAWLDESGNGRDATLETGVIAKNTRGDGIVLNGSTSWTFPDVAVGNAWTVNIWYKDTATTPVAGACILTQTWQGTPQSIIIGNLSGAAGTYCPAFNPGGSFNLGPTFKLPTSKWKNIQATWDGTSLKSYIDGVIVGTTTPGGVSTSGGLPYRIGYRWNNNEPYYVKGEIGELRIYNYAKSATEVSNDFLNSYQSFSWQPTSLTGLQLWFDGNDPLATGTPPLLDNYIITQWKDKSGLANNTTAVTGTPTFSYGKGLVFNGSSYFSLPNNALPYGNTSYSVYAVVNNTSGTSGIIGGGSLATSSSYALIAFNNNTVQTAWYNNNINTTGTYTFGQRFLTSSLYQSGGQRTVFLSGSSSGSNTPGTRTQSNTGNKLGGAPNVSNMNGSISEILVYNTAHTQSQRQLVEGYLASKWGIKTSLPITNSLYYNFPSYNEPSNGCVVLLKASDYSGSGTWLDQSGLGNNAIKENGVIAKNSLGNGIVLNGSTNWQFNDIGLGNSWTLSVWFKKTGANVGSIPCILTQQIGDSRPAIGYNVNGMPLGAAFVNIGTNSWTPSTSLPSTLCDNVWTNIQATWDGTNLATYVNSALMGSVSSPSLTYTNATFRPWRIGRRWDLASFAEYVNGEIGEVRIYNYAISATQVNIDFQSSYKTFIWQPTVIGGLQVWFDGKDQTSMVLSGSNVSQWNDKSGMTYNTSAVTGTPTVSSSGVVLNGSSYFTLPNGSIPYNNTAYSIYAVVTYTTQSNSLNYRHGFLSADAYQTGIHLVNRDIPAAPGSYLYMAVTGTQAWAGLASVQPFTLGQSFLYEVHYDPILNVRQQIMNGNILSFSQDSPGARTQGTGSNFLGRAYPPTPGDYGGFNGTISDVLVYNTAHTRPQRQVIEAYLAWKWGIQSTMPSTHPYYSISPSLTEITTGCVVRLNASNYSGSGAWLDESGYGRNATLVAGTIAKNAAGNGILLDGSTYWTFPNVGVGNAWSVSVWYKDTNTGSYGTKRPTLVMQNFNGTSAVVVGCNTPGGSVSAGFFVNSSVFSQGTATSLTPLKNTWFNFQATWDGTNMKTYINSVLVGTVAPGTTATNSGLAYFIGRWWNMQEFAIGEIGEVRMYNYPISQEQVQLDFTNSYSTYIWSPSAISGLQMWLDANETSSFTLNGSKITTWADKSGNSNNATGVNGPVLLQNPNTVTFNGNTQYLTTPYTAAPAAETVFVVYSLYAPGQFSLVESSVAGGRQLQNLNSSGTSLARSAQAWLAQGTVSSTTNTTYIGECLYDSTGINIYVNGALSVSNTTNPALTAGLTVIGGSPGQLNFYLNGTISEVLIYNSVLTATQRKLVEGYLAWKWSAQGNLATSHPYYSFPPNYPTAPASLASSSITTTGFTVSWSGNLYASSYTYTLNGLSVTPSTDNGVASKSAIFTGLTPGTLYAVVVTGVTGLGTADSSSFNVTTTALPPTALTSLNATNVTLSGFTLGWSGGQYATSYTYSTTPTTNNGVASKSAIFTGLIAGNTYSITVTASNPAGTVVSSPFSIKLPPSEITNMLTSSTTQTSFTLSWLGGYTATAYTYSLNGSLVTPSTNNGLTSMSAIFTGITPGIPYAVIINATNSGGYTTSSNSFNLVTAPTELTASALNANGFTISWSGGLSATSYTYVLDPITPLANITTNLENKRAVFTNLTPASTYIVKIVSVNQNGTSQSDPISILLPPSMPRALVTSAVGQTGFTITWTGGQPATSYSYTLNGRMTVPSVDNGVSSKIAVFSNLQPGVTYTLVVTAINSSGATSSYGFSVMTLPPPGIAVDPSQTITTAHMLWNAPIINDIVNTTPVLQKVIKLGEGGYANPEARQPIKNTLANGPKSATCSKMTLDGGVTITWEPSDNSRPILGYGLIFRPTSGGPTIQHSAYPFLTSLTISGLDPTMTYTCEVSAVNDLGWSMPPTLTGVVTAM